METQVVKPKDPRFVNFPSIYDFHRVIRFVRERTAYRGKDENDKPIYDKSCHLPVLHYRGSVKIHGTNGGIVKTPQGIHCQSRENVLSLEKDHFGLVEHIEHHHDEIERLFAVVCAILGIGPNHNRTIALLGEWAGDKIQTFASIALLPKFFTIAAISVDGKWQDMRLFREVHSREARIFNTEMFETFYINIDFARPDLVQTQLAELTAEIERQCPVCDYFGMDGIGEGLVWTCTSDPDERLWMKIKGQKHSNTNVRVLNTVDTDEVARHYNFVDAVVQLPRLEQAIHVMHHEKRLEINEANMSEFIRWIYADIVREEEILIEQLQIDVKKIGRPVSEICKKWYLAKLKEIAC